MEKVLTLGKLLGLWFCFHLHSILFLISQTSYRTYKIFQAISSLARPVMGTIFLVMSLCLGRGPKCVGGITWPIHAHAQSQVLGS